MGSSHTAGLGETTVYPNPCDALVGNEVKLSVIAPVSVSVRLDIQVVGSGKWNQPEYKRFLQLGQELGYHDLICYPHPFTTSDELPHPFSKLIDLAITNYRHSLLRNRTT
jgi:hypothetical protein